MELNKYTVAIIVILTILLISVVVYTFIIPCGAEKANFEPNPIIQDAHNRETDNTVHDPLTHNALVDFKPTPDFIQPEDNTDAMRQARLRYDSITEYNNLTPINKLDTKNPHIDNGTKFEEPVEGQSFVQEYLRYDKDDEVRHLIDGPRIDKKYYTPSWIKDDDMIKYPDNADFNGNVWEINRSDAVDID